MMDKLNAVMAAEKQVLEAAKAVAKAARVRGKRHYTNVDRYLQQSVDALEALEKR